MQNFWKNKNWEKEDKHFIGMKEMPFQRPFATVNLKPGLYSIRGPRQIGKSSWLKTLLSAACKNTSADDVYFQSCENISDYQELHELLQIHKKSKFIFLDEITFIPEWSRPIKHFIDQGYKGCIVVTGSNMLDLRQGADRMPGREGAGEDLLLLPMTFSEYLSARKQARWKELSSQDSLSRYFRIGGFPIAVAEAGENSTKTKKSLRTIEKWILGDVAKANKNELYAKDVLSQVTMTMTSNMSTSKLAQRTQIGSHHSIADYLHLLEDMFVLRSLYSIDPNTGAFRFKKEKKYYLTDPLIVKLALQWLGLDENEIEESVLAEMVAHEHLCRRFNRFGFLTSAKGGEVDFFAYKKWALEVKWSLNNFQLSKTYKDLTLPYKKVWSKENFLQDWPE